MEYKHKHLEQELFWTEQGIFGPWRAPVRGGKGGYRVGYSAFREVAGADFGVARKFRVRADCRARTRHGNAGLAFAEAGRLGVDCRDRFLIKGCRGGRREQIFD